MEPTKIKPKSIDDYLEQLSKGVFQAGISWRVVDAKWDGIRKAFKGFQVERVARMSDRDVDAIAVDERVIRSRPKIAAVVHNAREILALEREGGFKKHLDSMPECEELAKDLKKRFKFVGDSGAYHFLYVVSQPVPDWHDWAEAHGMSWGDGDGANGHGKVVAKPAGAKAGAAAKVSKTPKTAAKAATRPARSRGRSAPRGRTRTPRAKQARRPRSRTSRGPRTPARQ